MTESQEPIVSREVLQHTEVLPLDHIRLSGKNPRKSMDEEKLRNLMMDMAQNGLIQAVMVRPVGSEGCSIYELVVGHRRLEAARRLGWNGIRCTIQDMNDDEAFDRMGLENIDREDLTPMEEASWVKESWERAQARGEGQKEFGQRLGKTQSWVSNKLRILTAPSDLLEIYGQGKIGDRHVLAVLPHAHTPIYPNIMSYIGILTVDDHRVTVKSLESEISRLLSLSAPPAPSPAPTPEPPEAPARPEETVAQAHASELDELKKEADQEAEATIYINPRDEARLKEWEQKEAEFLAEHPEEAVPQNPDPGHYICRVCGDSMAFNDKAQMTRDMIDHLFQNQNKARHNKAIQKFISGLLDGQGLADLIRFFEVPKETAKELTAPEPVPEPILGGRTRTDIQERIQEIHESVQAPEPVKQEPKPDLEKAREQGQKFGQDRIKQMGSYSPNAVKKFLSDTEATLKGLSGLTGKENLEMIASIEAQRDTVKEWYEKRWPEGEPEPKPKKRPKCKFLPCTNPAQERSSFCQDHKTPESRTIIYGKDPEAQEKDDKKALQLELKNKKAEIGAMESDFKRTHGSIYMFKEWVESTNKKNNPKAWETMLHHEQLQREIYDLETRLDPVHAWVTSKTPEENIREALDDTNKELQELTEEINRGYGGLKGLRLLANDETGGEFKAILYDLANLEKNKAHLEALLRGEASKDSTEALKLPDGSWDPQKVEGRLSELRNLIKNDYDSMSDLRHKAKTNLEAQAIHDEYNTLTSVSKKLKKETKQ